MIVKTFNDDSEYTIPAAVVEKMVEVQEEKMRSLAKGANHDEEDMGLMQFIKEAPAWAWNLVRGIK
jgi:hypothetical protein